MKQVDIARLAGVNRSTVSKVLNNEPDVGIKTREKILKIIEETGYRPNASARSLASSKTRCIGVCFYDTDYIREPVFSSLVSGLLSVTNTHNYSLMITTSKRSLNKKEMNIISQAHEKRIDGAVIYDDVISDTELKSLKDMKFPFVLINRKLHMECAVPSVYTDFQKGVGMAVEYLLNHGHRRIGIVVGLPNWYATGEMIAGYKNALEMKGIGFDENLVGYLGSYDSSKVHLCIRTYLELPDAPTAIIFHEDRIALCAMDILRKNKISIPGDISIIGYNNSLGNLFADRAVTTINTNTVQIGRHAAVVLLNMIKHKNIEQRDIVVLPEIITGESTCPVQR